MVTLVNTTSKSTASAEGRSYSTYQEPDTRIPPKARPVFEAVSVNGVAIPESDILAEAQNHPSDNPGRALLAAARALVVRELLRQRASAMELAPSPSCDMEGRRETGEDAAIRVLIEAEVDAPLASEEECRRFYDNNAAKFCVESIYEASHILIAADPSDHRAREAARNEARRLAILLTERPTEFAVMARTHSACPSAMQGGVLGQLTQGSTVMEFERALEQMEEGQITEAPVETRFGFHIIRLERKIAGRPLPFETVQPRISGWLEAAAWAKSVSQYISILAAEAEVTGVSLREADGPLVQ